jgi:hypothetical protein
MFHVPRAPLVRPLMALALALVTTTAHADELSKCVEAAESAQSFRAVGRLREAAERFAACASGPCPEVVRKDCRTWGQEVRRDLPSVVLRVVDAEGLAVRARVSTDGGAPLDVGSDPIPLDPGPHTLRVEADGFSPEPVDVTVAKGEQGRAILVRLRRPETAAARPVPPPPPPTTTAPEAQASVLPWVFYGVSAVGLGAFTLLGLSAKSDADDLRAKCSPHCASSDVDRVRTRAIIADASLGVAIVSAGIGTFLLLRPTDTSEVRATSSGLRLDVRFLAHAVGCRETTPCAPAASWPSTCRAASLRWRWCARTAR